MTRTPDIYDPAFVKAVFDRCSDRCITLSYVFSMGFTERWRRECTQLLNLNANAKQGYDLMAGTGEVWPHILSAFPKVEQITAVDISTGMHRRAKQRLDEITQAQIGFIEDDVLQSSLPDQSADFVISTFGLKTFNDDQHRRLAARTAKVLRKDGRFAYIEASDPKGWILRPLYILHLKFALPLVERFLLKGAQDFAMIGTYSTNFGDASRFGRMLEEQGLKVTFRKHFFGTATSVSGYRP